MAAARWRPTKTAPSMPMRMAALLLPIGINTRPGPRRSVPGGRSAAFARTWTAQLFIYRLARAGRANLSLATLNRQLRQVVTEEVESSGSSRQHEKGILKSHYGLSCDKI